MFKKYNPKYKNLEPLSFSFIFCEDIVEDVCIHILKLLKYLLSKNTKKDIVDYLGLTYTRALIKLLRNLSQNERKLAIVEIISNIFTYSTQMIDIFLQVEALVVIMNLLIFLRRLKSRLGAMQNAF